MPFNLRFFEALVQSGSDLISEQSSFFVAGSIFSRDQNGSQVTDVDFLD